jgi:class 3 adenylate cyclase
MLDSYASHLLKDHLRTHAGAAASQRAETQGVLLFLDIAGSTAMSEQFASDGAKGAERLAGILNLYFGDVFGIIAAHAGDTVRIDGDAVLAFWRDAPGREAAALRAARAAIALRDAFFAWRPELGVRMRHRLALGAGAVTAASFRVPGSRGFFVLMGDAVHATTALSQGAVPEEIVATDAAVAALSAHGVFERSDQGSPRLRALRDLPEGEPPTAADGPGLDGALPVQDFMPRILVERAQAGHSDWLAEFRMLSMVYVHLSGLDVESAATFERLDGALAAAAEAIRPLGLAPSELAVGDKGVVLVVACGLPPSARENNAVRALESATRIRGVLGQLGLACSIGVATGRAFCGDVGSAQRREYLVTGPVMYYAARLMQAAAGHIVLDDATAQAAGDYFAFSAPEPLAVKGRVVPLRVHRLGERQHAAGRASTADNPLHGRDGEQAQLLAQLDALDDGRGGVLAITAEAGAGKSLLLAHVEAAARGRGHFAATAVTSPVDMLSPYFIWRALIPQLLCGPDAPGADMPALRALLAAALHGTPLVAKGALIEDILPLDLPDQGLAGEISGAARVAGIEDLVVHLACRSTTAGPMALFVDDVHWLDDPSARLLLAVARRVPRVLIALAARPLADDAGPHVQQLVDSAAPRLPLARLPQESVSRIVCDALGVRSIPARLADFVQARSEGLPFHAEQLALSLRDQRIVEIADGRCRLAVSDLPAAQPGHKIEDVIVSRIDTLDSAQQLVIKVASAIGRVFDLVTLRCIYPFGAERERLPGILGSLVDSGLLQRQGPSEAEAYAFRHVIIRDVTHALLVHEKREELHRQVAASLEERYGGELDDHFAALAEHLEEGRRPERAIVYRGLAAEAALRRHANHDALNHLDRVERLAASCGLALPEAQRGHFAGIRADACHSLSRFSDAAQHFRSCAEASGIAIPATRQKVAAGIVAEMARQLLHRFALVRRPAGAQERDRGRLAAHIYARLSEQAYFAGDALRIMHGTLASLNRAEGVGADHEIIEGYGALAIGLGTAGLHGAARFYRDLSVDRADAAGTLEGRGIAHLFAAVYSFQSGDWTACLLHSRQGGTICREIGDRFRHQTCVVVEAYTDIMLGDYACGGALLDAFGADAEGVENAAVRAWIFAGRAILDLVLGRPAATALANLRAARDDKLNRAEILLCDGLEVAAQLQAGEGEQALLAAQRALDSMVESAPTMGIALLSVGACTDFFVARAEAAAGQPSHDASLRTARLACGAARSYAAKTRIFLPRAELASARLALLLGRTGRARRRAQQALAQAERLHLPLEQALAHLALAGIAGGEAEALHRAQAAAILQRLGVPPGLRGGPAATMIEGTAVALDAA